MCSSKYLMLGRKFPNSKMLTISTQARMNMSLMFIPVLRLRWIAGIVMGRMDCTSLYSSHLYVYHPSILCK